MKKQILLVEYCSETIDKIRSLLRRAVVDLSFAGSEDVAKKLMAHRSFHLVICETLLPKSHGYVLSQYIHDHFPETKIVLMGENFKSNEDREEGMKYGACECFLKPLDDMYFKDRIYEILEINPVEANKLEDTSDLTTTNIHFLPNIEELMKQKFKEKQQQSQPAAPKKPSKDITPDDSDDNPPFKIDLE